MNDERLNLLVRVDDKPVGRLEKKLQGTVRLLETIGREGTTAGNQAARGMGKATTAAGRYNTALKHTETTQTRSYRAFQKQSRGREHEHKKAMKRLRERLSPTKGVSGLSTGLTGFGPGMLSAAGIGFGLAESVKLSMKFRSEMLLLRTQAGASMREVGRMGKAVLLMSTQVGQTPEALAKGLYHIESYGYRGAKALKLLRTAAAGAAVGKDSVENTANALLIMSKRGSGIKGAGRTQSQRMGLLDAIIGAGNMRMPELTAALGTGVLSSATNFGITMPELGAALATMTHAGVGPDEAGTRLKMMFSMLGGMTPMRAKLLKHIGIGPLDLTHMLHEKGGLGKTLGFLNSKLENSGLSKDAQKALLSRAFGGGKQGPTLFTMLQQLQNYQRNLRQIEKQTTRFGTSWAKTQKTAAFATMRFKASMHVLGITIGATLLPYLTQLANRFAKWLNHAQKTGKLQRDIHKVANGVKTAAHAAKTAVHWFLKAKNAVGGWKHMLALLVALKVGSTILRWRRDLILMRIASGRLSGSLGPGSGLFGRLTLLKTIGRIFIPIVIGIAISEQLPGLYNRFFGAGLDKVTRNKGGDYSNVLGMPIGPGSVAHDITRGKNPYPLGTDDYWQWQGSHGGKRPPKGNTFANQAYNEGHRERGLHATSGMGPHHRRVVVAHHKKHVPHHKDTPTKPPGSTDPSFIFGDKDGGKKKKKKKHHKGSFYYPPDVMKQLADAAGTKGLKDDLAALKAEEKYLRAKIAQTKDAREKSKLYAKLATLLGKEARLKKKLGKGGVDGGPVTPGGAIAGLPSGLVAQLEAGEARYINAARRFGKHSKKLPRIPHIEGMVEHSKFKNLPLAKKLELEQRLAQAQAHPFTSGLLNKSGKHSTSKSNGGWVQINGDVNINVHGQHNPRRTAEEVKKVFKKNARRNSASRRGAFAGTRTGLG